MPDFMTEYFTGLAESLMSTMKTRDAYLDKVALSAVIMVVSLLLHMLFKKLIMQNVKDIKRKFQLYKVSKQIIMTLIIVAVLFIWVQAINALILIGLLVGVFIVFMVKGLTNNMIGYFVIKYRRYFEVGHRVEINGIVGDVIDINPINFKMLEVRNGLSSDANTGRVIKLPNSLIFNESIEMIGVANKFVWHEIKYVLSFDSDWHAAEEIMTEAGTVYFYDTVMPVLEEVNGHLPSETEKLLPVFSVDTNAEGIILILRYMVHYRNGTSAKTFLQRRILSNFEGKPSIKFATLDIRILPE